MAEAVKSAIEFATGITAPLIGQLQARNMESTAGP